MKRTVLTDPYFYNQPSMTFIDDLKKPVHEKAPGYYGKRKIEDGEIDVHGLYIANRFSDDADNLLDTVYDDFSRFLKVYGIGGKKFPVYIEKTKTECFEAYSVEIAQEKIVIAANDTEGIRRGIIYLEDELKISENAFLKPCKISRKPFVKSRITRCFFSPINRAPKFGDELSDDIDYYPEEYLNRLMHEGANGVWIYTRFSDILPSSIIKEYGKGYEKRIEKLNRVIEKCRRYGIGVYVFAIEPKAISDEIVESYMDMVGVSNTMGEHYFCVSSERSRQYCYEAGKKLLELSPKLKGLISITYGERSTTCASPIMGKSIIGEPKRICLCERCKGKKNGEILALAVEALRSGAREINPDFETVSWTYGHRLWETEDILEYVDYAPQDAILMQNFDDIGLPEQLGKRRITTDYWMSYVGPSEMFTETAKRAVSQNKKIFAKMQVCCSHEIASVPYVPVPGIIFDKYKEAYNYGVSGVMQCWYFGNYPSLMSKVAGEISFGSDFSDKDKFLTRIAGIYFGKTRAKAIVCAWKKFEEGYKNYPLNIMFSYFGPMHDSVVWKLSLLPKNLEPARTWQLVDPNDGDRICDALLSGHTIEEALILCDKMRKEWLEGVKHLEKIESQHVDESEQLVVSKAIGVLFDSGTNILEFYKLRDELGRKIGNAKEILARMKELVLLEIENGEKMIPLCESCASLGYHSEAEGYKFFPEKIRNRNEQLKELLKTEFPLVEKRIAEGKSPLEYYDGVEEHDGLKRYTLKNCIIEDAEWENIGSKKHKFRMSYEGEKLYLELFSEDENTEFRLCPEFRLTKADTVIRFSKTRKPYFTCMEYLYSQMYYERADEELAKYKNMEMTVENGIKFKFTLDINELGLDKIRPMKMKFMAGDDKWCVTDRVKAPDIMPVGGLGKFDVIPDEYGWIIPEK